MSRKNVYVLGGYQTDFARNWSKEGKSFVAMIRETVQGGLEVTGLDAKEIETAHVGNFAGGLFCKQGHMGAFFLEGDPAFSGLPTSRHEAACASGSIAMLAASADIEAERYKVAAILGVEAMKTVNSKIGGDYLGTAAWYDREAKGIEFPFPKLFGRLGDEYDKRYGLKSEHLDAISVVNYSNAKLNPLAQTRNWYMSPEHAATKGEDNPAVGGRIHITDCSQVTDGAAILFLASEDFASKYAQRHGRSLQDIPRLKGFGHSTAPIMFDDKVAQSRDDRYVLPTVRDTALQVFRRAGMAGIADVDGLETHDCFTTSEYMAIDHFGITAPGESWKAVEEGWIEIGGKHPINPSGGLIGAGHPVGATGVRQCLDAYKQVCGIAGDYQVPGAKNFATLNIGGSGTTSVAFIIGL